MKPILLRIAALLGAAFTATLAAHAGPITVKGSDTMVTLAQKWAETYMSAHADAKIQVVGGGSGVGLAALQNKTTDLANASRKIRAKEIEACVNAFGARPREYAVALDGLSVYVNDSNPVSELTLEQLSGIFTGKIRNWKAVGGNDAPIVLYSRENSSGTYEFFKEHVLGGRDFAASAQTLQGTAQILGAVTKDTNAIGYGGAAYGKGAKALKVAKDASTGYIEANEETVLSGKYPISRNLYIYLNPAIDKGEIRSYIDWIRGEEGQKVVKAVGYFPLPPHLRKK
jgi:phosphate transport system substrate-binding protein